MLFSERNLSANTIAGSVEHVHASSFRQAFVNAIPRRSSTLAYQDSALPTINHRRDQHKKRSMLIRCYVVSLRQRKRRMTRMRSHIKGGPSLHRLTRRQKSRMRSRIAISSFLLFARGIADKVEHVYPPSCRPHRFRSLRSRRERKVERTYIEIRRTG